MNELEQKIHDIVKDIYEKNGKTRRGGENYFVHCYNVAQNFKMLTDRISMDESFLDACLYLAYCHDIVEDNILTKDELVAKFHFENDYTKEIFIEGINVLTKRNGELYEHYLSRINASYKSFKLIKIADILDNVSDKHCSDKQREKYRNALTILRG